MSDWCLVAYNLSEEAVKPDQHRAGGTALKDSLICILPHCLCVLYVLVSLCVLPHCLCVLYLCHSVFSTCVVCACEYVYIKI